MRSEIAELAEEVRRLREEITALRLRGSAETVTVVMPQLVYPPAPVWPPVYQPAPVWPPVYQPAPVWPMRTEIWCGDVPSHVAPLTVGDCVAPLTVTLPGAS